jgi:4'-phosphopantetheinyl transferase EntD
MPIFYQQDIDESTKLAIWKIEEDESFFLSKVPLQNNISHGHKRLQHLAGRYLLQFLFPGFPVNLIKVADTLKPFLEDEAYHFSISHCGNFAAAIVSKNCRVGVDIEIPDAKLSRVSRKFLHESELEKLEKLPLLFQRNGKDLHGKYESYASQLRSLALLWSCKEAVFKWWSYGKVDFRENIRLDPGPFVNDGMIPCIFTIEHETHLDIHYKMFDELGLAWISTPGDKTI